MNEFILIYRFLTDYSTVIKYFNLATLSEDDHVVCFTFSTFGLKDRLIKLVIETTPCVNHHISL